MDLVDMGLELDLCLGRVMDQVEAMVQDQGLDIDQVQGAINLILLKIDFSKHKLNLHFAGISKLNYFCYSQAMELDQNLLNMVLKHSPFV